MNTGSHGNVPRRRTGNQRFATPKRAAPRPFTEEEHAEALALFEKGLSYTEVGRKLRRNPGTLRHRFPGWNGNSSPANGAW